MSIVENVNISEDNTTESFSKLNLDELEATECLGENPSADILEDVSVSQKCALESQMRSALNQQTIIQYKQYAAEQHPKDSLKQEEMVRDLQEKYFYQYMTCVYAQQVKHQEDQLNQMRALKTQAENHAENGDDDDSLVLRPLVAASLWTRKDIAEFKSEIYKYQRDCCIKISSLAVVTVKIPTHSGGNCVYWEFATDHYDLGFGVYFEWDIDPPGEITVHISESSDEEEDDDDAVEEAVRSETNVDATGMADIERGRRSKDDSTNGKPQDELMPVYRRDCHKEVYCGYHEYPGKGIYLLKFDNSFSLWRSKWLYYRIYYTK